VIEAREVINTGDTGGEFTATPQRIQD